MDPQCKSATKMIPPMSSELMHGFVKKEMDGVHSTIKDWFRTAFNTLPSNLKFIDLRRCSPEETYRFMVKRSGTKPMYEMSKSSVDLYRVYLSLDGKPIDGFIYLYVPFCDETNQFFLRGTSYTIAPILADAGVSITPDGAFIQLTCVSITAKRQTQSYFGDVFDELSGSYVERAFHVNLPYPTNSKTDSMYRAKSTKIKSSNNKPKVSFGHYLFCRCGIKETFRRYLNTDIAVGTDKEITPTSYPRNEWMIFRSIKLPHPHNRVRKADWYPTNAAIAIKTQSLTRMMEQLVGSYFYAADCFPDIFNTADINRGIEDDIGLWRKLMAEMIFDTSKTMPNQRAIEINSHFESLETQMDDVAIRYLRNANIVCHDIYDLFIYLINELDNLMFETSLESMYDKRFMVQSYILSPIRDGIFNVKFQITQNSKRLEYDEQGKPFYRFIEKDIIDAFRDKLKPEAIYDVKSKHGEIISVGCPGDNLLFKVTNQIVLQSNATRRSRKHTEASNDRSKILHSSIAEVSSFLYVTSPDPTARSRANPWGLSKDGYIVRREEMREILDETQCKIANKFIV